jgi:hypothetical protein
VLLAVQCCWLVLLQAAICPAFVSRPEGRKFLACLLTVHPSMVQEITSVIRNQVGQRECSSRQDMQQQAWRQQLWGSAARVMYLLLA